MKLIELYSFVMFKSYFGSSKNNWNKYNVVMDPGNKINKSNKPKLKNPANWLAKSIFQYNPKYHDIFCRFNGSKKSSWYLI